MMKIRELFAAAAQEKRKLFIPYITCGDPTLSDTLQLVEALTTLGADIIELGVPFSDPLADGRTNQLAAMRALKNQVSLNDCCAAVKKLRQKNCQVPIVLFTYLNPIIRMGMNTFADLIRDAGVDAVLVVDLPLEEAEEFTKILSQKNIGSILLIAPTTSIERVVKSDQLATAFLYYVSRTGVTGTQQQLSASLESELQFVKQHTTLPIAVGFGVSTAEHAAAVAQLADGVIVGSALVKNLEMQDVNEGKKKLLKLAANISSAIKICHKRVAS